MMGRRLSSCSPMARTAIAAAAMLVATAAQAAIDADVAKTGNGKPGWFNSDTCHSVANTAIPASIASPTGTPYRQLSALDRMRLRQDLAGEGGWRAHPQAHAPLRRSPSAPRSIVARPGRPRPPAAATEVQPASPRPPPAPCWRSPA